MAQIDIRRPNSLAKPDVRQRTEDLARRLATKFGFDWEWSGDDLTFSAPKGAAKGTRGTISVADTSVRVQVALPVLLRAFKRKVEDRVNDELDKLLA